MKMIKSTKLVSTVLIPMPIIFSLLIQEMLRGFNKEKEKESNLCFGLYRLDLMKENGRGNRL